ncbi:MAG: hypothetical protein II599_04585, partial [Bacteroidales bacterium]|nr:hypothetical protein [Bacteroidales bacterium]
MTSKKKSGKKKQAPKKTSALKILVFLALFVFAVIVGGYFWNWYSDNRRPNFMREAVIYVREDSTVDEVYAQLINEAGVKRPYSLDHAF